MNEARQVELAMPFGVDNQGRIAVLTDPSAQLRAHVLSIIGTGIGDRVMRPGYGTPVADLLFEADDAMTTSVLSTDIQRALEELEPGIVVHSVDVPEEETAASDGVISLSVVYSSANSPLEEVIVPVNTASLFRGGSIVEERRG